LVNPSEIAEALVAALRDIPDLVAELGGDETRIYAYHDRFPDRVSHERAKETMEHPAIMIVWMGTRLARREQHTAWEHRFSLFLRAKPETGDPPDSYYKLYRLILTGVPAKGDGLEMQYATIHPDCLPFGEPGMDRTIDTVGVDLFEISLSFDESS
jgi:hypothetical protein